MPDSIATIPTGLRKVARGSKTVIVTVSVLRVEKTPPFLSNDSNIKEYSPAGRSVVSMTTSVAVEPLVS